MGSKRSSVLVSVVWWTIIPFLVTVYPSSGPLSLKAADQSRVTTLASWSVEASRAPGLTSGPVCQGSKGASCMASSLSVPLHRMHKANWLY